MAELPADTVGQLRAALAGLGTGALKPLVSAGTEVIARYQPMFSPTGIRALTADDFRGFLMFRNNRHWSGLQRLGPATTQDMTKLRSALLELANEEIPIERRIDGLIPGGRARVKKLGKAILTPVLLIMYPDRYGVWNGISEASLRRLKLWPTEGPTVGVTYKLVNETLNSLAASLGTNLWTLDALWWRLLERMPETAEPEIESPVADPNGAPEDNPQFGLERHLHDFLVDNWERTELGRDWVLCEEGGDVGGYGSERQTDVGVIDLLARDRTQSKWLVVELKRDQTSDQTVGQVLRYMGWVKQNLAKPTDSVEGLVIALDGDERLKYALMPVHDVRFMRYEVSFKLRD